MNIIVFVTYNKKKRLVLSSISIGKQMSLFENAENLSYSLTVDVHPKYNKNTTFRVIQELLIEWHFAFH